MADWAQIGEVISRCLGYPEVAFIKAYKNNLAKQNQHALEAAKLPSNDQTNAKKNVRRISSIRMLEGLPFSRAR